MKTKIFIAVLIGILLVASYHIVQRKKLKEYVEILTTLLETRKSHDLYMKRCMDFYNEAGTIDSLKAREICSCIYRKAFDIDSNFVYLEGKEMEDYVNAHIESYVACIEAAADF
ncbi:MAG: hypothetical protein LBM62_05580 [Mediterranea sp.]|jgi:hypothetical protein|nr:hypothetical protein [Mediterranea sp.]